MSCVILCSWTTIGCPNRLKNSILFIGAVALCVQKTFTILEYGLKYAYEPKIDDDLNDDVKLSNESNPENKDDQENEEDPKRKVAVWL